MSLAPGYGVLSANPPDPQVGSSDARFIGLGRDVQSEAMSLDEADVHLYQNFPEDDGNLNEERAGAHCAGPAP